jgi:hypothetical protein
MKEEELQAKKYHSAIEEEEDFDIEESEEETITLDFDKGVAIQEGVIVGEGLLDSMAEALNTKTQAGPIAKGMAQVIVGEEETSLINTHSEEEVKAIEEAEKDNEEEKVVEVQAPRTYKDDLSDLFIDTLTSKAIGQLLEQHHKLEKEFYDELSEKHYRMGKAFQFHQRAFLESLDDRRSELKKSYGFTGRLSYEHIPEWAKPYIEDYIKGCVQTLADFSRDVD